MSTTRYNKYVPLFGPLDDRRPRILINIAEDQYLRSLNKGGDITVVLDNVPKEIDSAFYKNSYGLPNGSMSAEFIKFMIESANYITTNKKNIISLIKSLSGISKDNLHNAVTHLIITVMQPKNAAGVEIRNASELSMTEDINVDYSRLTSKITADKIMSVDVAEAVLKLIPNELRDFSYQYDTHFISSLLEEACAAAEGVPESSDFFGDDDIGDVISREYRTDGDKNCGPTTLVIDNKDGHFTAKEHLRKNFNNNCATTGVTDDGAETCQGYLRDCLQGKNIRECARYMKNNNFWAKASAEVRSMNPLMIIKTLDAFQFPIYIDNDGLRKVADPHEWLKSESGLSNDEKMTIASNHNLMGYLKMLVVKTNRNPTILNPSTNVKGYVHHMSRLNKLGIPHAKVPHGFNKDINNWINATRAQTYRVGALFGMPTMFNGLTGTLVGGAYTNNLDEFTKRNSENYIGTGDMFAKHVEALNYRLQNVGKQIHQGDLAKINQLIDSLKNSERKLNKTMLYAEKYARLLEVHGIKDNSGHVLSMDHLKEFVDQRNKYFERVTRRQTDLYSILTSIAAAVTNQATNTKQYVKSNYKGLL
jgi:hypothetical protein